MKVGEVVLFRKDEEVDYGVIESLQSIGGIDNVWSHWSDCRSVLRSPVSYLTVLAPKCIGVWK